MYSKFYNNVKTFLLMSLLTVLILWIGSMIGGQRGLMMAFILAAGMNFVGPEDYRVAREDYRRHMEMIGFLAKDAAVALHAGELWLGIVPPEDLTFHIRQAVEVAGARRIGHGVALAYERRSNELLDTMRRKPVATLSSAVSQSVRTSAPFSRTNGCRSRVPSPSVSPSAAPLEQSLPKFAG